jgi:hypothetical protein
MDLARFGIAVPTSAPLAGDRSTRRCTVGSTTSKAAASQALLCRVSSWLTRTSKPERFLSRRAIGASLHRRSGAGGRPSYQGRLTPSLAGLEPQPLAFELDLELEGKFSKIVVGAVSAVSLGTALERGGTMTAASGWRAATPL